MSKQAKKKWIGFTISLLLGLCVWNLPPPEGTTVQAIRVLAIFVFTICGIILRSAPMGTMAFLGLTFAVTTRTLSFGETFSGFVHPVVWLVVFAFFISRGLIVTGLGERLAYCIIQLVGKSPLSLAYGIVLTDLILAPTIPSMTARVGGIIYPIVNSLAKSFGSEPHAHPRRLGAFLMKVSFQSSVVVGGLFLTSMAGNPLIADIAKSVGIEISWRGWAIAASMPGLVSLVVIPFVLYKLYPPELQELPNARLFAAQQLKALGPMGFKQWVMVFAFILLIVLWILGPVMEMPAVVATLLGLSLLLLTGVISWDDVTKEKGAWNTLIWFATLVMMAGYLGKLGLSQWFGLWVEGHVAGLNWVGAFLVLSLVYFYSHYFFASVVAHIGAMYAPFLLLSISVGTPPMIAALMLGFFSNLFGGLTHYGCGPAPIFFGAGYLPITSWWRLGLTASVINIIIYLGVGSLWWGILGYY